METRRILGERLKRSRMRLGWNQLELAEETGIPQQVISRLEHGHQSIYVERLIELATTLKVSLDYLVGLSDDPAPVTKPQRRRSTVPVG
jgi:transcriptional regulator with XRE-family HTH domain